MEKCTQGALNQQSINELKEQTKLLFELNAQQVENTNAIMLTLNEIKVNGVWLKDKVENHIKNSIGHIEQIEENKQASKGNTKMVWFLFVSIMGAAIYIIRDVLTKGA